MKIKQRSFLSLALCLVLCAGLSVPVLAAEYPSDTNSGGITATVTATPDSLNAGEDATVTVTVAFSEAIESSGFNANVSVPSGWSTDANNIKATLSNDDAQKAGYNSEQNTIAKALAKEYGSAANEYALITGFTIKYTVTEEAAASETVGLTALEVKKVGESTAYKWANATTNVAVTKTDPDKYTVALSSSKDSVEKNGTVDVYLDVTHASYNHFNAFYAIMNYESTKVTYDGEEKVNGFDVVNNTSEGTLTISRTGDDIDIPGNGHELILPFKDIKENTTFTLSSAKVDEQSNAELTDAFESTKTNSPLSVTVLETYTITFDVDGATGTAPTMNPATAGSSITLPSAENLIKEGYAFSGWSDGTNTYQAGASYTMPEKDVTFTALWAETPVGTVVSDYTSVGKYTLIKVTGISDGNAVTYGGKSMVKDGDAYYIAVEGATAYDPEKLSYAAGKPETLDRTKEFDVNLTNKVDINDAQLIYNIYNGATLTREATDAIREMLLADANKNSKVEIDDCSIIVNNIK